MALSWCYISDQFNGNYTVTCPYDRFATWKNISSFVTYEHFDAISDAIMMPLFHDIASSLSGFSSLQSSSNVSFQNSKDHERKISDQVTLNSTVEKDLMKISHGMWRKAKNTNFNDKIQQSNYEWIWDDQDERVEYFDLGEKMMILSSSLYLSVCCIIDML